MTRLRKKIGYLLPVLVIGAVVLVLLSAHPFIGPTLEAQSNDTPEAPSTATGQPASPSTSTPGAEYYPVVLPTDLTEIAHTSVPIQSTSEGTPYPTRDFGDD
jgi:hypothetical protein